MFSQAYQYALSHRSELLAATGQHLVLVSIALGIGIFLCVPSGILTSRSRVASSVLINLFNGLRVVPSLAILFLMIPYFGLSSISPIVALTILALPPILINTDTAFRTISPAVIEAAYGMGMTPNQVLRQVEFPLALPVILSGIRTSALEVISSATLAAFIGAGGLGIYITRGFALYDNSILLVGAVPVALLSLVVEILLSSLQHAVQPPS
jgi:osmoprotectant transport system permease protein